MSIPLGKLGYYAPRTFSRSLSMMSGDEGDPRDPVNRVRGRVQYHFGRGRADRHVMTDSESQMPSENGTARDHSSPSSQPAAPQGQSGKSTVDDHPQSPILPSRAIRFLDETPTTSQRPSTSQE